MRKIKIMKWVETSRNDPDKMIEVDTCSLIQNMVRNTPPNKLPTGLDAFTVMRGLHHSLKNAEGKEHLLLEDNVFDWLKENCFNTIPAAWGLMDSVAEAIIELTNAEQYDPNEAKEAKKSDEVKKEALPKPP